MSTDTTPKLPDLTATLLDSDRAGSSIVTAHEAMSRFTIAGDDVARATATLSDKNRSAMKWLLSWLHENKQVPKDLVGRLKKPNGQPYSYASIYAVMTGRRAEAGVGVDEFCAAIERFRRHIGEIEPAISTVFIQTELTQKIFRACRRAFEKHRLTFIFGESQIGKTTALAEYARLHNHGQTYMVRMPTRGYMSEFLDELAHRLYVPAQQHTCGVLKRRIFDCFDERTLLIVDECHQCFNGALGGSLRGVDTLDLIREIHDRRKCGVVLCGTNVFRDGLLQGPYAKRLRQLWLRRFAPLQLPAKPSLAILDDFARAFGLPPAPDKHYQIGSQIGSFHSSPAALQQEIIARDGLGLWVKLLEDARDLAEHDDARMQWRYVLQAYGEQKALEEEEQPNDQ